MSRIYIREISAVNLACPYCLERQGMTDEPPDREFYARHNFCRCLITVIDTKTNTKEIVNNYKKVDDKNANLGITPFREIYDTKGTYAYKVKQFNRDIKNYAKANNVEIITRKNVGGVWKGGAEPSESLLIKYRAKKDVEAFTQKLVDKYNQDSGMVVYFNKAGKDSYLRFPNKVSLEKAVNSTIGKDIGLTYKNGYIEMANYGRVYENMDEFVKKFGKPQIEKSSIKFINNTKETTIQKLKDKRDVERLIKKNILKKGDIPIAKNKQELINLIKSYIAKN